MTKSREARNNKPLRNFSIGEKRSPYTLFTPYRTSKNCGHSSSVEWLLPKQQRAVRFRLPAPYESSEPPNRRLFLLCSGKCPLLTVHAEHTMLSALREGTHLIRQLYHAFLAIGCSSHSGAFLLQWNCNGTALCRRFDRSGCS